MKRSKRLSRSKKLSKITTQQSILGVIVIYTNDLEFQKYKTFEIPFDDFRYAVNHSKINPENKEEIEAAFEKITDFFKFNIKINLEFINAVLEYLISLPIANVAVKYSTNEGIGLVMEIDKDRCINNTVVDKKGWNVLMNEVEVICNNKRVIVLN